MVKKVQNEEECCLIILVDDQVNKEFFDKMVNYISQKYPIKKRVNVICKNIRSVVDCNYHKKIFKNIINEKNLKFKIICFYDTINNHYKIKPYINWKKIKETLKCELNVLSVHNIKANNSIEDWILKDIEGLCNFLDTEQIPKLEDLKGDTGEEKIRDLFLKNSNIYQKGYNVLKFMDYLNFETLYTNLVDELKILEKLLFIHN